MIWTFFVQYRTKLYNLFECKKMSHFAMIPLFLGVFDAFFGLFGLLLMYSSFISPYTNG